MSGIGISYVKLASHTLQPTWPHRPTLIFGMAVELLVTRCSATSSKVALPSTIRAASNADQFCPETPSIVHNRHQKRDDLSRGDATIGRRMQTCARCGLMRPDSQDQCDCAVPPQQSGPPIYRRFRRGWSTTIAVALLIVFVPWAWFALMTGFQDSMGTPINTGLAEHIYVYAIAFGPLLIPALLLCWGWRRSR